MISRRSRNLCPRPKEQKQDLPESRTMTPWVLGDLIPLSLHKSGMPTKVYSSIQTAARVRTLSTLRREHAGEFSRATSRSSSREGESGLARDGKTPTDDKRYLSEVKQGACSLDLVAHDEVGHTDEAKKEILSLFGKTIHSILQSQSDLLNGSLKSPPTPATWSSTPSPVPAPPARWPTRWAGAGSWWSWASTATRTSSRG